MKKLLAAALIALLSACAHPSFAQPGPTNNSGGIPAYDSTADAIRQYCVSTAGVPATCSGGGGSITATATAADPTYTEGSTTAPHSLTLDGYLRSRVKAAASSFADGWDVTQGAKADAAWTSGSGSVIAILKAIATAGGSALPAQAPTVVIGGTAIVPSALSGVAIAPSAMTSAAACKVFKASPGNLYSIGGYAGQAEFILVFDATAAPADGGSQTPVWVGYAGAAGAWGWTFAMPMSFANGITACFSSGANPYFKTAISTNNFMTGQYQ